MPASARPSTGRDQADGVPARDFRRLPESPSPEQWFISQDVRAADPGPQRFDYSEDAGIVLRYLAGG